jgi:uncharacterized OB-fold protein
MLPRCAACGTWALPWAADAACDVCGGAREYQAASGRGVVYTYTTNAHQFHPAVPSPNLIAIVQLDEQDDLRLATNLVGCSEDDVECGTPVSVVFERNDDMYYPLFQPAHRSS